MEVIERRKVMIDLARKNMGNEWDILKDEILRMLTVLQDIAGIVENPDSRALQKVRDLTDEEFGIEETHHA